MKDIRFKLILLAMDWDTNVPWAASMPLNVKSNTVFIVDSFHEL